MRDPQAQDAHAAALEALERPGFVCPEHRMPDCSPLLNGCSRPNQHYAALASLRSRLVVLERALGYIARSDSWQIVGFPEHDMEGTSLQFIPPDDTVYATPWGFARSALGRAVSVADIPQEPGGRELTAEQVLEHAENTARALLGVSWAEALAELEGGELDGTAAESALRGVQWLLSADIPQEDTTT